MSRTAVGLHKANVQRESQVSLRKIKFPVQINGRYLDIQRTISKKYPTLRSLKRKS